MILSVFVVLLSTSCSSSHQVKHKSGGQSDNQEEVRQIENQWKQALLNQDSNVLRQILADEIVITTTNGVVESKSEFEADIRSGARKYHSLAFDDVKVSIYEDTAIVTGRAILKDSSFGQGSDHPGRFTRVYVKEQGRWKMVASQSTDISAQ
jgi:ketosteroid isomerase-like protein